MFSFLFTQRVAHIGLLELLCSDCYMRGEWVVCYKHIARCLCLVAAFCGQVVVRGGRMCLFENTIYLERNDGE